MKFICLGYFKEAEWNKLSPEQQGTLMEECFLYDDELRRGGHFAGGEALQSVTQAVTVRPHNGGTEVTDGPFIETKEQLGGILILEARDLNHAIALMSKHPGVRAGGFEIRPSDERVHAIMMAREKGPSGAAPCEAKPRAEHQWLQQMVGEWTFEGECQMGPDQPPMKSTGRETVRSVGGLWVIGEGEHSMPDGDGTGLSVITLGFDPQKGRFVGSFVASMMDMMWRYDGALDADQKVLTLDTVGPNFGPGGGMARFQDIVELVDRDHRTLRSRMLGVDGQWTPIMEARYQRVK